MIRINLLGTPKPKGKRLGVPSMPSIDVGDAGSPKMKVLVVVALAGLLNLGYWYRLDPQSKAIAVNPGPASASRNRPISPCPPKPRPRGRSSSPPPKGGASSLRPR